MKSKRLHDVKFIGLVFLASFLTSCSDADSSQSEIKYAVNTDCEYGKVLLEKTRFKAGENVNFEIFSTDYTQYLKSWDVIDSEGTVLFSNVYSFVMPSANVTINANFERYKTKVRTIAHRGLNKKYNDDTEACEDFEVPNTLESFTAASKEHFYGMETDVHLTKDNVWVCTHDKTFLSNGKSINIANTTIEEIENLPLDNNLGLDRRVCKLEDYLLLGKKYNKICLVEVKEGINDFNTDMVHNLVDFVGSIIDFKLVKFISFYSDVLDEITSYNSKCKCQYLLSVDKKTTLDTEVNSALRKGYDVSFEHSIFDEKYVTRAHQANLMVNAWTINSKGIADIVIGRGTDYLTTDGIFYKN